MTPPAADPRYQVENDEIRELLQEFGRWLRADMPRGWGFTLFLFTLDTAPPDNSVFYISSSAEREGMHRSIEEWLVLEGALEEARVLAQRGTN